MLVVGDHEPQVAQHAGAAMSNVERQLLSDSDGEANSRCGSIP